MKIAFIGGGNMAEAMISAVLEKKRAIAAAITVADIVPERPGYLARTYGIVPREDNVEAVLGKDIVILAVKPQQFPTVLAELKQRLHESQLVISIAAGVKISSITQGLNHAAVVRAMPNTPARIGRGITGWTCTGQVSPQQRERAKILLGSMGEELYFENESALDMVTAVSGSGPAYVFYFTEALTGAAEKIGLGREDAARLALYTLLGAGGLLETSGQNPAELRQAVTSKGGTTERAIDILEAGGFKKLVEDAVKGAYERARELGA